MARLGAKQQQFDLISDNGSYPAVELSAKPCGNPALVSFGRCSHPICIDVSDSHMALVIAMSSDPETTLPEPSRDDSQRQSQPKLSQ